MDTAFDEEAVALVKKGGGQQIDITATAFEPGADSFARLCSACPITRDLASCGWLHACPLLLEACSFYMLLFACQ